MNSLCLKLSTWIGLFLFLVLLPLARAELVFEENEGSPQQVIPVVKAQEVAQPAQVPQFVVQVAPRQPVQQVQAVAPALQQAPQKEVVAAVEAVPSVSEDTQEQIASDGETGLRGRPSKAEMLRRQRTRVELKNEDLLSAKLEELRLQDEMKRTNQLLSSEIDSKAKEDAKNTPPVQEAVVTAAPVDAQPVAPSVVDKAKDQVVVTQAAPIVMAPAAVETKEDTKTWKTNVRLSPVAGLSTFTSKLYDVEAKYAAGVSIGSELFENVVIEAEFVYSNFNVTLAQSNPFFNYPAYSYNSVSPYLNNGLTYHQNVFDLGMKFFLFDSQTRIRPFLGAGLAYIKSYSNYDQTSMGYYSSYYGNVQTQNYEANSFSGFLQAGLEFQVSKNVSIGALGRFFNVFSARENRPVNNYAFMNPGYNGGTYNPYAYNYNYNNGGYPSVYNGYYTSYNGNIYNSQYLATGATTPTDTKDSIGQSLTRTNFYQLMGSLTISF